VEPKGGPESGKTIKNVTGKVQKREVGGKHNLKKSRGQKTRGGKAVKERGVVLSVQSSGEKRDNSSRGFEIRWIGTE